MTMDFPDARPSIFAHQNIYEVVERACSALAADPDLYQRDGRLVRLVRIEQPLVEPAVEAGTPLLVPLTASTLRCHLARCVLFQRMGPTARAPSECQPPNSIVNAVLERARWPGVRVVVAVSETPIVRPDFSIASTAGYDEATATVYAPGKDIIDVPDAPSQADAARALATLCEPFADFPFRSESDRYVPIAAILTLLARQAIAGAVPAFLFDASTRGSGKTLQADVVSIVATGRPASRMSFPRDDEAELEKILGAYAIRSAQLIAFDNCHTFGGSPIDRVLTAIDSVDLRVLGRSEVPTLAWRAVILATGNNLEISGDTCRRVICGRLEPTDENPEARSNFRHPNLRQFVSATRPQLVRAALCILRAWACARKPRSCPIWGSFESWSEIVPNAITFAGGAELVRSRIDDDTDRGRLEVILDGLKRLLPNQQRAAARTIIAYLYAGPPSQIDDFADLRAALEEGTRTKHGPPSTHALGYLLRSLKGRFVGGAALCSSMQKGTTTWFVSATNGMESPQQPQLPFAELAAMVPR